MAPLSLFRLKKQSNHNSRRPQNIVVVAPEPLSPDSFFSPDRSPSLYAADFVLGPEPSGAAAAQQHDRIDEQVYPQQDDVHHGVPRQQPLFPQHTEHTDLRDIRPPSLPVSALSAAHTITPGPPNLALRLSFDAEGSLGDSIERYFMSSRVDGEMDTSAESPLRRVPDPGAGAGRVGTSSQPPLPVLLHPVENVTVNTANHPTRGPIIPSHHPDSTANLTSSDTNYVFISLTNHQVQPNSHDLRSLHSKLSSGNSDDRSLHESPVLHASDRVLDISPSASRVDLPPSPFKPTIPAPTTPVVHKLPLPPPPEQPPPVPPKSTPGPAHRKRGAPAPIKIPNGSMHAPKVIVERVPAEQSTTPTTVAPPRSLATATTSTAAAVGKPRKPQRHAGKKRSVEEIEHSTTEQVEEARKEVAVAPRPTRAWTVASSRKSTASAFFACEYDEFSLPPSSGGDRLSVVQPPTGRADSATLPEDSPGWQAHRFIEDDKETENVPPVPALPQTLRWTRSVAANANNDSTRVLVVPKRESSLLPSAISAKLLPIALRQSDASATSEAASSSTFSQFISGYQHRSPSPPQDAVSIESVERKSVWSDKARSPMASEAELTIARTRTASPATTQPSTRGPSPSAPMTPAGILGLEKTGPIPNPNPNTSRPTTVSPVLHSATPPRNKSEDTDAPHLPRDGSSQAQAQAQARREWRSPRTDSLRPSRAVELLKASRDSAVALLPSVPPTPGTGLTQYLDMYTNTEEGQEGQEGQDKDGTDDPASTGSSSFSTGPSSLFGTSAAGRSPYSLYQGTTPGSGQCTSSTPATSKTFVASVTAAPAPAAAASPDSTSSSSSVKPSRLHIVPEAFNGNGGFRTRSVSDAPPASAVVPAKNTLDRRPSLPESSTPGAADPLSAFFPDTLSAVVSGRGVMERALLQKDNNRPETSLRSTESTRPALPTINTNPPPPPRDLRESMFPHTPHSFSPEQPNLDQLLDDAKPPGVGVGVSIGVSIGAVAVPPLAVIAAEPAPTRPKTLAETRASVLSNSMSRSYPSLRGPMSSSSSVSSFYRRDRTLPIGPRKPTIKRKGAEQEASRPPTATTSVFQAPDSNATLRAGVVLPTPVTTPPGQASSKSKQRERSTSISPYTHTHSRTRTKSSASTSTSASASVMEKIARPATPTFDTTQVQWRGLTLDAAKWMFSSQELHAMVGRAIRQSADPMCIRLLPTDLLDRDLPAAVEDLEVRREEIKAKYKYLVKRRRTLMRALAASVEGAATPVSVLKLVEELSECTASCDRLSEELFLVSDQIAQIGRLRDGHSTSALAMALRKINTSFLRATGEVVDLKAQVETLTAEREEAWAKAEEVERDLDELRARVETMEQQNLEQQQRHAIQFATSALSRSNSRQGCLSRSTSRVSAARKSSMRVSKASLRSKSARSSTTSTASWRFSAAATKTPATSSPLFLVPPVPRIPRGSARNSDSADAYTPSPRGTPRALVEAQNELLEMLGIPIHEFKNGSFIPAQRRRSHSAAIHSWARSPPASPLDHHQPPASPVPIPKAPPASKLFRSASIAEHARLSRRRGEAYSTVDMEMIYDGILDDPETLFAVLKN